MESIDFGKYKRMKFSELPISYLYWLRDEYNSSPDINEKAEEEIKKRNTLIAIQYEEFIGNLYCLKGYKVEYIGFTEDENGKKTLNKKDAGIDIIAKKNGYNTKLIQCKHWTSKYNKNYKNCLTHKEIKQFERDCYKYLTTNEKIEKLSDYDFILVLPKKENLEKNGSAEMLLKDKKNKTTKLEIVPMLKNDEVLKFKLIAGIIEAETICCECEENIKVIALLFYCNNIDNFLEIEEEKVYYNFQELPRGMLELIQEKYPQYDIRAIYDIKDKNKYYLHYIANHCVHCGTVQRDKRLYEDEDGIFKSAYKLEPKYFIGLNEKTGKLEYISEFFNYKINK